MLKQFLGTDAARELWVRAQVNKGDVNWKQCPSCRKHMIFVKEPGWVGNAEIDIGLTCHLIWIDADEHSEIPHPEDLLNARGDSSLLSEVALAHAESEIIRENKRIDKESLVVDVDSWGQVAAGMLGVPIEFQDENRYKSKLFIILLSILMVAIHYGYTSSHPTVFKEFGFIPNNPFQNGGITFITAAFLHVTGYTYYQISTSS